MIEKLKEALILQGKLFLETHGEFFPFATAINSDKKVIPIGVYFGEETPAAERVLEELEKAIKKGKEEKRYLLVGICTDVLVIPPGQEKKTDALELRIDGEEVKRINFYVPYKKEAEHIKFGEAYSEEGNLVIW